MRCSLRLLVEVVRAAMARRSFFLRLAVASLDHEGTRQWRNGISSATVKNKVRSPTSNSKSLPRAESSNQPTRSVETTWISRRWLPRSKDLCSAAWHSKHHRRPDQPRVPQRRPLRLSQPSHGKRQPPQLNRHPPSLRGRSPRQTQRRLSLSPLERPDCASFSVAAVCSSSVQKGWRKPELPWRMQMLCGNRVKRPRRWQSIEDCSGILLWWTRTTVLEFLGD